MRLMKKLKWTALGLIVFGAVLLAVAVPLGDGTFSIWLIVPVYTATGAIAFVGGLMVFLGVVVGIIYFFKAYAVQPYEPAPGRSRAPASKEGSAPGGKGGMTPPVKPKHGGVVFLGPIPLVWGSSSKMALIAIIIGIIIAMAILFAVLFGLFAR